MILFLSGEKKLATPLFFEKVKEKNSKPPLRLSKIW